MQRSTDESTFQSVSVQIEKDGLAKDQKNMKSVTKTYHTIKDIISSRFKSNKDSDEKLEESGLNNVTEELRKSQGNIMEEIENKKATGEQGRCTWNSICSYLLTIIVN